MRERDGKRWILAGDLDGPLPGLRIGPILHPTVLLALADGAGFEQDGDRPAFDCPEGGAFSLSTLILSRHAREILGWRRSFRLLTQGRDSESSELKLFHVFRRPVHRSGWAASSALSPLPPVTTFALDARAADRARSF